MVKQELVQPYTKKKSPCKGTKSLQRRTMTQKPSLYYRRDCKNRAF